MSNIRIDDSDVQRMFYQANKKSFRTGSKKAAKALQDDTRIAFKKQVKAATHKNYWNGKRLYTGIRYRLAKEYKDTYKVHIMGDFRLKFFEGGTDIRKTKKGYNRGRMKALNYFERTRNNSGKYIEIIKDEILYELQK